MTRPKGCRMSIVEAVWQPKDAGAPVLLTNGDAAAGNGKVVAAALDDGKPTTNGTAA